MAGTRLKAAVGGDSLLLSPFFEKDFGLRSAAFRLTASADWTDKAHPSVEADIRLPRVGMTAHTYRELWANGSWRGGRLVAELGCADSDLDAAFSVEANIVGKTLEALRLAGRVEHCAPKALAWSGKFGEAVFSATLSADVHHVAEGIPLGELRIKDFTMVAPEKNYRMDEMVVASQRVPAGNRLSLHSDFASAEFEGRLSSRDLKNCGLALAGECLPGLMEVPESSVEGREWKLRARMDRTDFLNDVLGVPLYLKGPAEIEGNVRADGGRMAVVASVPGVRYKETALNDLKLYVRGAEGAYYCLAQVKKDMAGGKVQFAFEASAHDSLLETDLSWKDLAKHRYGGRLSARTAFIGRQKEGALFRTDIVPTEVAVGDSLWKIAAGHLEWGKRRLSIDGFRLAHGNQSLTLDGRLSQSADDSIVANLQRMDIDYLLGFANIEPVSFAGQASGKVVLSQSTHNPRISAYLTVEDFLFNNGEMGQADIKGSWEMQEGRIYLSAGMNEQGVGRTLVEGYVSPKDKNLDLSITSFNTNLHFLRRYVGGIFEDLSGRTTGTCRLYGPFKQLDFEGKETVNMSVKIPMTGVTYDVTGGTLDISSGRFDFNDVTVTDKRGGDGKLAGTLYHKHLKNLSYEINAETNRLLLYDLGKSIDMPFYATVFGSGHIHMDGYPGVFNADISIRPERGTDFVYTLDTPDTFNDVSLLTIRDKSAVQTDKVNIAPVEERTQSSGTDIHLNFLLEMTPEASMKIITNEKSGDFLTVHGSGPMRASFYNKGGFNLFGTYTVADGVYKMNIQDIIRKDFELTPGSSITFSGDPYDGDLKLRAVYVVNSASLSDLNIGNSFSESSVRVNCILNLNGKVNSPEVSFDLDLPTVNEDEKQMVRNIISTEEDMNMQILYLLGVGRFYTYDYNSLATSSTQSQSSVAMKSFLSNTLSSQLNDIISNAIGSSNWSFGANLSTGSVGWSDMEVEGLLSGRLLNNRLIINGNFGYRDRSAYSTNFVGDFDIRYLLTPNGNISLKAYSETNDRYFTKSSLTTQGVGIMLKRDFSNLRDLFSTKRKRKAKEAEAVPGASK